MLSSLVYIIFFSVLLSLAERLRETCDFESWNRAFVHWLICKEWLDVGSRWWHWWYGHEWKEWYHYLWRDGYHSFKFVIYFLVFTGLTSYTVLCLYVFEIVNPPTFFAGNYLTGIGAFGFVQMVYDGWIEERIEDFENWRDHNAD